MRQTYCDLKKKSSPRIMETALKLVLQASGWDGKTSRFWFEIPKTTLRSKLSPLFPLYNRHMDILRCHLVPGHVWTVASVYLRTSHQVAALLRRCVLTQPSKHIKVRTQHLKIVTSLLKKQNAHNNGTQWTSWRCECNASPCQSRSHWSSQAVRGLGDHRGTGCPGCRPR